MSCEQPLFADPAALSDERLQMLLQRWPWMRPLQQLAARRGLEVPALASLIDPWRAASSFGPCTADAAALLHLTPDDLIDRFLQQDALRIVAEEGEPTVEVRTEADLDDEEQLVSEPLARIYAAQGLHDEAIAIYRRLSLLNPEKSVYFAELIEHLESEINKN